MACGISFSPTDPVSGLAPYPPFDPARHLVLTLIVICHLVDARYPRENPEI